MGDQVAGVVAAVVKMNKYWIIAIVILAVIAGGFFINSNLTGNAINNRNIDAENLSSITLKVSIPCGGHAYLIKSALNNLNGVEKIEYSPITTFIVYYDSNKTSEQDILNLDIFKDYPARKAG